jgi:hypothetical protein
MVSLATIDLSAKTAVGMEHRARSASSRRQTGVFMIIMTVIGVVVVSIENVEFMRSDDSQKAREAESTRQSPRGKVHEAKSTKQCKGSTKKGHEAMSWTQFELSCQASTNSIRAIWSSH